MDTLQLTQAPTAPAPAWRIKVIVIGAGQAGLSVGYHLARRNIPFVILDANERVGDSWRKRWDTLQLFTPAQLDGLDGMRFPAPAGSFPSKDQMGDYLEAYARRFELPVRNGVKVDGLTRSDTRYLVTAGAARFKAEQVVVAMANYQQPSAPDFARDLDPRILQLHSCDYRNPAQVKDGAVLLAGAGNSGAEIAVELARTHDVLLAGRDVGEVPFRIRTFWGRHVQARLVLRFVFHRLLTTDTPMGRKARASHHTVPLIRTKTRDLLAAGVKRTPRVVGVRDGRPLLEDGRMLDVATIIWCTGYHPDFSWIDRPIFDASGLPRHQRGVAINEPGLYFVGLNFLYAASSTMIHGVGRDAKYVAKAIAVQAKREAAAH